MAERAYSLSWPFTIGAAGVNGFTGIIALTYGQYAPDGGCSLNNLNMPSQVAAGSAVAMTLTPYTANCFFQITANASGDSHVLLGAVFVSSAANFGFALPMNQGALTATPTTQAASVVFTPSLTVVNGFCGTVNFQVTGLPTGASVTAPSVNLCANSPQTAQVTVTAPPGTPQATSQLTINAYGSNGNAGQASSQYIYPYLQVGSGGSTFSISASPPQTTAPGGTAQYTITVNGSVGLGNVTLTATGGPPGATVQLGSASVAVGGQTTLTVTAPSNSGLGTYPVKLTGMLGTVPKYATAMTNIAQAAAASVISPTPGALPAGQNTFTFTWNSGIGATQYQLAVGPSPSAANCSSAVPAQTANVTMLSGSTAYVTLSSVTPAGCLAQSYVYFPSGTTGSVTSLGMIGVQRNAPAVTIFSPLPSDTVTGCSVPPGVTAVIAGVAGSQTVSFTASAAAQYGTTPIACSTAASMTMQGSVNVGDDYDGIYDITATQTGAGAYHLAISGFGFGDEEGYFSFGGTYTNLKWSDSVIEADVNATDGVCGSYPIGIDPIDFGPLPIDDFGPQPLNTSLELCPDVTAPTYTISGQVTSTATANGNTLRGVSVSITNSCNSSGIYLPQYTDANGMYYYSNLSPGCSYTLTASYLNYTFKPNVASVPNLSSDAIANFSGTPIMTVFLLHGIGQGPAEMQNLANNLAGPLGIDPTRFRVDAGYSFASCAAVGYSSCPSSCGISNGAQALATYVANAAPPGNIILVGFSLGGLIARDLILNNYYGVLNGRKVTLVTLATPSLGYPYISSDSGAFCPHLVEAMSGNWRYLQSNGWPLLSSYAYSATQNWQAGSFPGASGFWLAAYGQSCSQPIRSPNPSVIPTGCRSASPTSDGVVCADSASYNISTPTGIGPSLTWTDPGGTYVHSNAGAGLATAFLLCGNPPNPNLLYDPPTSDGLFQTIVAVINGR